MSEVTRMYFEREVIGTPENCKRVWSATVKIDGAMTGITLWQDGAWWCMQLKNRMGGVWSNTWGNAQHIMQELAQYGLQADIDHIDFNASNFNV
jgi:hypothetical protein